MTNRIRAIRALSLVTGFCVIGFAGGCSDTVAPAPPATISIVSGNLQYSKRGTPLPEPLVVKVLTETGEVPQEAYVAFSVLGGGGTVSSPVVQVDGRGVASTMYTLGPDLGIDSVLAQIQGDPSKSVAFQATSSNFYCPEAEDTLRVSYATTHHLFLFTHNSSLYTVDTSAGIVEIGISPPRATFGFGEIKGDFDGLFDTNVFDAAFSARGDLYVARRSLRSEILKIDQTGRSSVFARLFEDLPETDPYAEIAMNPSGLLVGCDAKGPFIVGCRDTLRRFEDATYQGGINSDAVAVDPRRQSDDPLGEDIYFIDETTATLMRLAMDGLDVETRGVEPVTALSEDEAKNARGMVCERREGNVYILVDSDVTKELLEVTPGGDVTVLYDFFDRGEGSAAGVQRDLAYDEGFRFLYTLDTLNDNLLLFDVGQRFLVELFDDPTLQGTLSNKGIEGALIGGERVGLVVLK